MIEFDPGTWARGAAAIADEAAAFHRTASATLTGSSDVATLGAAGGATLVDQAVATTLPPVFALVSQTITELADGLGQEAALMQQTGAAYADVEAANQTLGSVSALDDSALDAPGQG